MLVLELVLESGRLSSPPLVCCSWLAGCSHQAERCRRRPLRVSLAYYRAPYRAHHRFKLITKLTGLPGAGVLILGDVTRNAQRQARRTRLALSDGHYRARHGITWCSLVVSWFINFATMLLGLVMFSCPVLFGLAAVYAKFFSARGLRRLPPLPLPPRASPRAPPPIPATHTSARIAAALPRDRGVAWASLGGFLPPLDLLLIGEVCLTDAAHPNRSRLLRSGPSRSGRSPSLSCLRASPSSSPVR